MSKATLLTDAGVIKNETTNSANTATRVGEMFEDIINEALIPTYKVYRALLTQTGTNAPVATVLENTLGLIPTYSYQDVGSYALTAPLSNPNPFTENKTTLSWTSTYFTLFGGSILTENRMNAVWSSTSQILIYTVDGTTATNNILNTNQWWIEIIVYD
jgi:hypothetical protein